MNRLTRLFSALAVAALVGISAPLPVSAAPDSSLGVLKVSAGGTVDYNRSHTCAILSDRSMWCWGANDFGQLGDPSLPTGYGANTPLPNKVVGDHLWETFDTGEGHTCAIDTAGALWCWGADSTGQLGNNNEDGIPHPTPTKVGADNNWTGVTSFATHTCAIKSTGTIWCWGYGDSRLGIEPAGNQLTPAQVGTDEDWAMIDAGYAHTCATKRGGTLWCWGHMIQGDFGTVLSYPTKVSEESVFGWVGAGGYAACTITTDSSHLLACIGENGYGQGGNGSTTYSMMLTPVTGGGTWISAGLGSEHTCGVQANNTLWCFGNGGVGRLGTGNETSALVPVQIGTDHLWTAVDSGPYHSCAITTGRDLYCWGYNSSSQLGDGTTTDRFAPVLIIDGAELPATNAAVDAQRAQILAQLALLAAVCAFAVRMSTPAVESKGKRRR